jgi:hypothetical protein
MRPEGYAPFQPTDVPATTPEKSTLKSLPTSIEPESVGLDHWGQRKCLSDYKITDKTLFYTTFTGSLPSKEQFRALLSDSLNESELAWWESAVKQLFTYTRAETISASDITHFFLDLRGLHGLGSEYVIERLRQKGLIVSRADFEKVPTQQSGLFAWTASFLFSGMKSMYSMATRSSVAQADTEYVYLPNIQAEAKIITDWIDSELDLSGRIMSMRECKERFPDADTLVLKYLENNLQRCYRFKSGIQEAITFLTKPTVMTEELVARDRSILKMKDSIQQLEKRVTVLEKQFAGLGKEAVNLKKAGKDQEAKNKMLLRKQVEKKLHEVSTTIETVQQMIYKINDSELLPDIMQAMKSGAAAIKEQNAGISVADADEIMMDAQEEFEKLDEINRALAGESLDEMEFEEELEALTSGGKPHSGSGAGAVQIDKNQDGKNQAGKSQDLEEDALLQELNNLTLDEKEKPIRKQLHEES